MILFIYSNLSFFIFFFSLTNVKANVNNRTKFSKTKLPVVSVKAVVLSQYSLSVPRKYSVLTIGAWKVEFRRHIFLQLTTLAQVIQKGILAWLAGIINL